MLEFIVLGQIPGTQLQTTFVWYLCVVLMIFTVLLYMVHKNATLKKSLPENANNKLTTVNL